MGRDGTPDEIDQSYQELRGLYGLPPRDLEYRRYIKIQSAMCSNNLGGIVAVLKKANERTAPVSEG
jgi:hypothetical protein